MNKSVEKTNHQLLEQFYRDKQEEALEEQRIKLHRAIINESSKHYITKCKFEKEEIARLDAEDALVKERQIHEQIKREMHFEIANLKHELEKYKSRMSAKK